MELPTGTETRKAQGKEGTAVPLQEIREARARIAPYIRRTPLLPFDYLSQRLKKEIWLKCENLQRTGSFKLRGATNCVLENLAQAKKCGVVAASAGNHAQGVAAICSLLGIKATIVMPTSTPPIKIQNTQSWGAEAVLHGNVYDESFEHASALASEKGYVFIHPFRDPLVIAGQGTIGLELSEEESLADVEAVIVPVGGGGLITGIASALKTLSPDVKIYGVTAKSAPAVWKSYFKGTPVPEEVRFTLAEGVATKRPDEGMLRHIKANVDEMLSLSEESIAHAISVLAEQAKLVVEGAGALAVAAIMENQIKERKVVAVLSGGNIDLPALGNVLHRGLVEQGRLVRFCITIMDRPGGLFAITQVLAEKRANIMQVFHQRNTLKAGIGETEVEVDIETRGQAHTEEVAAALAARGFKVERVS